MKIAFLTTQSSIQSTVVGRVFPLAKEFQTMGHDVVVFLHEEKEPSSRARSGIHACPPFWRVDIDSGSGSGMTAGDALIRTIITGRNPFERTESGKKRYGGLRLLMTMKINAIRAAWGLITERPDYIILVKPLPENTLAVALSKLFLWKTKVILDMDDFELFANNLSSFIERAAIHLSQRVATALASHTVVATPFLYDHIHQLVAGKKEITMIPTGLSAESSASSSHSAPVGATRDRPIADITPSLPVEASAKAGVFPADRPTNHTMLYIGSISLNSGHRVDLLPEILDLVRKKIPDARLVIAGKGDDEAELKKQFQRLALENAVTLFGRFTHLDIPALVASCDVLIDPIDASIVSRAKSSFRCALALVHAMPIVTSSIGIRTELIPSTLHEKFFAIPADAASYAAHVINCMQTPLSDAEKNAMREQSKKYTWEHLARVYSKLFL